MVLKYYRYREVCEKFKVDICLCSLAAAYDYPIAGWCLLEAFAKINFYCFTTDYFKPYGQGHPALVTVKEINNYNASTKPW